MDWMGFFADAVDKIHKDLAEVVVNAAGCREGWLQGELFLAGRERGLRVNECAIGHRKKADLSFGDPPTMVAEIKIIGAGYFPKQQYALEEDVNRMRRFAGRNAERYMILVIPSSDLKTRLGTYLNDCTFSRRKIDRSWDGFRLRIWKL